MRANVGRNRACAIATLTLWLAACGGSSDGGGAPQSGTCSPAHSVGDQTADCASYCAVLKSCVGCSDAVETTCKERCSRQREETACFTCALDHISEVASQLSCDEYQGDAGFFTLLYRRDSCEAACNPDAAAAPDH